MTELPGTMTPKEIVDELDKNIIGQHDAKRAVAIALRNRWRRQQVPEPLRKEITPKNILMIGPTGVGKTEIARRLASLANAPFIKVEATKFTEVGYVGRDVESIIRDLLDVSVKVTRETEVNKVRPRAREAAEDKILNILLPPARSTLPGEPEEGKEKETSTRKLFRQKLKNGDLDDKEIEVALANIQMGVEIMAPPGMEEMTNQLQGMFKNLSSQQRPTKKRKMSVKDALKQLEEEEAAKLINEDEIKTRAVNNAEQNGIVFIDEIDKIVKSRGQGGGGDVSREGVQRDLLPLVEGCTVSTKYGMVKTDHILFVASGAFQLTRPSDLVAELQGRLPIRVELADLKTEDFVRILTEPNASLVKQYRALMLTEGCELEFADDAIEEIAKIAYQVNKTTENIGARRLHTVMERLLEHISFDATNKSGETFIVDAQYVKEQLNLLIENEDLSRSIL